MLGISLAEHFDDGRFRSTIHLGDKIVRCLQLDGELVEIIGSAADDRSSTARRLDGDI